MTTPMLRIKKVLAQEFAPKGIKLERSKSGKISGWIISKSFEGQSSIARQQRIAKLLNEYLDPEDQARIVMMMTITPLERKLAFEEWIKK